MTVFVTVVGFKHRFGAFEKQMKHERAFFVRYGWPRRLWRVHRIFSQVGVFWIHAILNFAVVEAAKSVADMQ